MRNPVEHCDNQIARLRAEIERRNAVGHNSDEHQRRLKPWKHLPGFIENDGGFVSSKTATVAQWRAGKTFPHPMRRTIFKMVRLADRYNLSDDVPLWPRLRALANLNVTTLRSR